MRCAELIHAQRIRAELQWDAVQVLAQKARDDNQPKFLSPWGETYNTQHTLEEPRVFGIFEDWE